MTPSRTVPPDPQRFLSLPAKVSISDIDIGRPVTVVTPLPALPLVSRPTRTADGLAAPGAPFGHTHSRTGLRPLGQRLPTPVEYTMRAVMTRGLPRLAAKR